MNIRLIDGKGQGPFPKRMEPAFSLAFFRKCEDGAVILNADGRIGFMNDPARDTLGLKDISDVVQRHWTELWSAPDREQISTAFQRALQGDAVRLVGVSSVKGPVDMLMAPIINQDSVVESIFAVIVATGQTPRISG